MPNLFTVKANKIPGSLAEIEGEISAEEFQRYRAPAIRKVGENLSLPGFRPGYIPEDVLIKHVGEARLLEEMAELAIRKSYPDMVAECDLNVISHPEIKITKLAFGNPLGFKAVVPIMPEIILPDYKKIASGKNNEAPERTEAGEKETEALIEELRKGAGERSGDAEGNPAAPELTDAFARSLGDFKDLADLKAKARDGITKEKEMRARDKKRLGILEEVVRETKIDLPEVIILSELGKMLAQFKGDIEGAGLKFDEYLKHTGKTEESLRKEWREDAKKRASFQLVLNKIAVSENIKADRDKVDRETAHILGHHEDLGLGNARAYVEMVQTNEKVFEFLENIK